jgi:hypothetical protein
MAEKNSLWKNIRNKAAKNRRTGAKPKEPTKEMLKQEAKIKAKKYAEGGETDPPYRPLSIPMEGYGIPMEGYEPDSVFYETPTRYSKPEPEPVIQPEPEPKPKVKPKPTSKRSEVQNYYLNQTLNQNSSTPRPDRYVAERDTSSTKLSPAMSTKEWQEGSRSFGPTLNDLDVVTDVMQLGNFVPHPLFQTIGKVGNWGGSAIDAYQAAEAYDEGNYSDMAINIASAGLGAYLGGKGKGYTRDMNNTVSGSVANKIANLGSKSGSYRPLTAYPHLRNNAVIQRGLNYNRGILGGIGAETIYDSKAQGGYMYAEGGGDDDKNKIQKAVASTTAVNTRALPEGLFESIKANPIPRQPEIINLVDKRKYNPVTKGPINPNRDLVGGQFKDPIINEIISSAYKHGVDPYTALAIGLQESRWGKTDPNIGHVLYANEDYTPGVDEMVSFIKEKEDYAKKLGYKDKKHFIQAYNGLGNVYPETEQNYHGFKMKSIYGVPVPKEGINLAKNPLYGEKIINLEDSVLKQNPDIVNRVKEFKPKMNGGPINPYMYYAGGPMYYGNGGKVWKHIGAGAYALGEGLLDTITMGATDQITDRGFEWLTKVGNKNLDLNDPKTAKFYKTQQQIKGYGNTAAALTTAAFTGQWGSAIGQSAKGLNTAFQASDWASDDFKKWSNIGSTAIGIGAGFAGSALNTEGASKGASEAATKFGAQASKVAPYANQAVGMFGKNEQPLWQQAEARQEYLNSPEYLAMKEQQNQAYVNQGLSFASHGGNINNNSLNLQTGSMRENIKNHKKKYSKGGTFHKYGINSIPDSAGLHHQNAYGGVPIGQDAMAEGGEFVIDGDYVISDKVNGMNTLTKDGKTMAEIFDKYLSPYKLRDLNSKDRDGLRRPNDSISQHSIEQKKEQIIAEHKKLKAKEESKAQQKEMMVNGALQYAAAGGKINKDIEKILNDDIQSYIEADNYYAYGGYLPKNKKFNMPYSNGGKLPKEVLRARVQAHMSIKEANSYVDQYDKGGYVYKPMVQPMLANGGPI